MAFVTSLPLTRAPPTKPSTSQKFIIRAAKHAQFKGAKKADRCRPKKHRPSDIHRKPPPFNPEPLRAEGLPPVFEVFKPDQAEAAFAGMTTLIDASMVEEYEKSFVEPVTTESGPVEVKKPQPGKEPEPVPEAEPVTAENESAVQEAEPAIEEAELGTAEAEPVTTEAEPVTGEAEPVTVDASVEGSNQPAE